MTSAGGTGRGVEVSAGIAARGVRLAVDLPPGTVSAIVGPNGAGKSTLVGLVAGTLAPDSGSVTIDGAVVADGRRLVPPHRRPLALLDQRPLLFPHLDVLDNVAFGVRARGASRAEARARALRELEAVDAQEFAHRRTRALSGGEAQRVALARALATDPTVVLLDEPFASLDVATAAAMRRILAERLPGDAAVALITHDPLDVWALADRVVALQAGCVVAAGTVDEVLARPATPFVAGLTGQNLLRGVCAGDADDAVVRVGEVTVTGLWDASRRAESGHPAYATFPPAAVALFSDPPHGSPRNTWPARVTSIAPRGETVRVHLDLADDQALAADLTARGAGALGLAPGDRLVAQVKATQVTLYAR